MIETNRFFLKILAKKKKKKNLQKLEIIECFQHIMSTGDNKSFHYQFLECYIKSRYSEILTKCEDFFLFFFQFV